jgi:hypothetical protein
LAGAGAGDDGVIAVDPTGRRGLCRDVLR